MKRVKYYQCENVHARRIFFGLDVRKPFSVFANNKGADHPARMRNLINACDIRLLETIISKLDTNIFSVLVYRGSNMSFYVLLNLLLKELRKRGKM